MAEKYFKKLSMENCPFSKIFNAKKSPITLLPFILTLTQFFFDILIFARKKIGHIKKAIFIQVNT